MKTLLRVLVLCCASATTLAATTGRPRIALALSGGGAKGIAHVGVLKVLEEVGLRPDIITGTSIGAIVGALHAIGYSADELAAIVSSADWQQLLFDRFAREELRFADKQDEGRFLLEFSLDGLRLLPPVGISRGQRIRALFTRLTWPVHHVSDFSKLPIPFACVATDLESGEAVVLSNGSLPLALRASMSIPGFFSPVVIDNRLLVDGCLVRNLPVGLARQMGADLVIGVDVGDGPLDRAKLQTLTETVAWITMFQNHHSVQKEREACTVLIRPAIDAYHFSEFPTAQVFIDLGEAAAREQLAALRALAAHRQGVGPAAATGLRQQQPFQVAQLHVGGLQEGQQEHLQGQLGIAPGTRISAAALDARLATLAGSGLYMELGWSVHPTNAGMSLALEAREAARARLRLGYRCDTDRGIALLADYTVRGFPGSAGSLELATEIGGDLLVVSRLFLGRPFQPRLGLFLQYRHDTLPVYRGRHVVETLSRDAGALTLALSTGLGRDAHLQIAAGKELGRTVPDISFATNREEHEALVLMAALAVDTLDRGDFPRSGIRWTLAADCFTDWLSLGLPAPTQPVLRMAGDLRWYLPLSARFVLFGNLVAGGMDGPPLPEERRFHFGGVRATEPARFPFPGLAFMEVAARNALAVAGGLRLEFVENLFCGVTVGHLRTAPAFKELAGTTARRLGWSVEAGMRTLAGPLRLALAGNGHGELLVEFAAGGRF